MNYNENPKTTIIDNKKFVSDHPKIFNPTKISKYWRNQKPKTNFTEPFIDPSFPPGINSLMSLVRGKEYEYNDPLHYKKFTREVEEIKSYSKNIKWVRASKLVKNPVLFDQIEISDIKQGKLGNCYFLSAISSFAEFPEILKRVFKSDSLNEFGYYELVFFVDGEWQCVIVDDYIPILDRRPLAARPNGNEIWVLLIEKAFAKLNGGYTNMIGGKPTDVFYLNAFRNKTIKINNLQIEDLMSKLLKYNSKSCVMCCSTKNNRELLKPHGLEVAHAYSLIEAKQYFIKNQEFNDSEEERESISLLQIRNPWGRVEPDLDWNDNSPLWTSELKKFFGFPKEDEKNKYKDDGMFFLSIDDFYKYYNTVDVSYPTLNLNVKTLDLDEMKIDLKIPQIFVLRTFGRCKLHVVLDAPSKRFNRDGKQRNNPKTLMLLRYYNDRKKFIFMDAVSNDQGNLYSYNVVDNGIYILYMFYGSNATGIFENDGLKLSVKSTSYFYIEHFGSDPEFKILPELIWSKIEADTSVKISKNNFFCESNLLKNTGICYYLLHNKSDFFYENVIDITEMCDYSIIYPFYYENTHFDHENHGSKHRHNENHDGDSDSDCDDDNFISYFSLEENKNLWKGKDNNNDSKAYHKFARLIHKSFYFENGELKFDKFENSSQITNENIKSSVNNLQDSDKRVWNFEKKNDVNFIICRAQPNSRILILFFNKKEIKDFENKIEVCQRKRFDLRNFPNENPDKIFNQILKEYDYNKKEYCIVYANPLIQKNVMLDIQFEKKKMALAFDPESYTYVNDKFFEKLKEVQSRYIDRKIVKTEKVEIENLDPNWDIHDDNEKKSHPDQEKINELITKYPHYMEKLNQIKPLRKQDENRLKWTEIIVPNHGKYIGTVNHYNIFHGRGIYIFDKLNNYCASNFFMGKRSGDCNIFDLKTDKPIYSGSYKKDVKEGSGTIYFKNNERYEGYFKENKMEGKGKFFFKDGSRWEGFFTNNKMNGDGDLIFSDKSKKRVSFQMGILVK